MQREPTFFTEPLPGGILRFPSDRSKRWLTSFLSAAQGDANVIAVVAVGSAVRPNVSSADLDVIVIGAAPRAFAARPPVEIDLRTYRAAEVYARIESGHDLLGSAVTFGKVLFQREGFWDRVVESWHDRLPLPSTTLARERAKNAYRHLVQLVDSGDADAAQEQATTYLAHLARAELLHRGIYPASRPELASQLRAIGSHQTAEWLERIAQDEPADMVSIRQLLRLTPPETSLSQPR